MWNIYLLIIGVVGECIYLIILLLLRDLCIEFGEKGLNCCLELSLGIVVKVLDLCLYVVFKDMIVYFFGYFGFELVLNGGLVLYNSICISLW